MEALIGTKIQLAHALAEGRIIAAWARVKIEEPLR